MLSSLLEKAAEDCGNHCCESAVELLEAAVKLKPADSELYYRLGICYSGGCRRHGLTSPEVAVEYLRRALSLVADSKNSLACAGVLDALGNVYAGCSQLPRKLRFQAAMECHQMAASIYQSCGAGDDWARSEYNLGNAWCELPEGDFPQKWSEAIRHYEQALQVRTRECNPVRYAATMQNLGTAYRQLPTGERSANILKANECYRIAMRIFTLSAYPLQNAALYNNLGNSYLSLPFADEESRTRNALLALEHLDRALRIRTQENYPIDYAVTQFNRGHAFLLLAASSVEGSLEKAAECFQEAHDRFLQSGRARSARMVRKQLEQLQDRAVAQQ